MAKTIGDRVCEVLDSVLTLPKDFDRKNKLDSFGLDSLDLTEIIHEIEIDFSIRIDESDLGQISEGTVDDLINYVESRLS